MELVIKTNRPQKLYGKEYKAGELFPDFDPDNKDHQRLLRQGFLVLARQHPPSPKKANK